MIATLFYISIQPALIWFLVVTFLRCNDKLAVTLLATLISQVDKLGHRSWPELLEHLKIFLFTTIVVNKVAGLRVFMNAMEHQYTGVV